MSFTVLKTTYGTFTVSDILYPIFISLNPFLLAYLSLPNVVWRLIVFAPFLLIIIIIILLLLLSLRHERVHGRSQELLDRIS